MKRCAKAIVQNVTVYNMGGLNRYIHADEYVDVVKIHADSIIDYLGRTA